MYEKHGDGNQKKGEQVPSQRHSRMQPSPEPSPYVPTTAREQVLSRRYSRRLVVMRKARRYDEEAEAVHFEALGPPRRASARAQGPMRAGAACAWACVLPGRPLSGAACAWACVLPGRPLSGAAVCGGLAAQRVAAPAEQRQQSWPRVCPASPGMWHEAASWPWPCGGLSSPKCQPQPLQTHTQSNASSSPCPPTAPACACAQDDHRPDARRGVCQRH